MSRHINLFQSVLEVVAFNQPWLQVRKVDGNIEVEGRYLLHENQLAIDSRGPLNDFELKIRISNNYPKEPPVVFETGGKIPRIGERHINRSGDCCILVWEHWQLTAADVSFGSYFTGPLHQYFLGQHHYDLLGYWPFGERAHGFPGLIEAYAEVLEFPDMSPGLEPLKQTLRLLSQEWPKGHWPCPCGSAQKLRKCHWDKLKEIHGRVSPETAKKMLKNLSDNS